MAILPTFLPLNPDVEKHSILNKRTIDDNNLTQEEQFVDLKNTYYYIFGAEHDKLQEMKEELLNLFRSSDSDQKISSEVLRQSFEVLESLYPSLIEKFNPENLTRTSYGTIVLDWEKDEDNVFSLEIGANKIGYFIEQDGQDIKQIDEEDFIPHKNELFQDLGTFLG